MRYREAADDCQGAAASFRSARRRSSLQKKGVDEGLDLSIQHLLHVGGLQARPVVFHELVGGEDVRTNLAAPGDIFLFAFELGHLLVLLPPIVVIQPGAQDLHGHGPVLVLRPLVLT